MPSHRVTSLFSVIHVVGLYCSLTAAADSKQEIRCEPPKEGPQWLRNFTPERKQDLKVRWEAEEKKGRFTIKGTYSKPQTDPNINYTKYVDETYIKVTEDWVCGPDLISKFNSVNGKMETSLKWKRKTDELYEKFYSNDEFEILSLEETRHTKHEDEKVSEVKSEFLSKKSSENTEWVRCGTRVRCQVWQENMNMRQRKKRATRPIQR